MQCNVTLWRVCVTIAVTETQQCILRFFTLSLKRYAIGRGGLLNIQSVLWFSVQLLSAIFDILRRIHRYIINVHRSACKGPVILVRFWWNLKFLERFFRKVLTYHISWTFIQWGPGCCMRTHRRTWSWWSFFEILRKRLKKKRGSVKLEQYLSSRYTASPTMLMVQVVLHYGILSLSRSPVLDVAYPVLFSAQCMNIP
jgi:hypothetical protein